MKKIFLGIIGLFVLLAFGLLLFIKKNTLLFVYLNPYTETKTLPYIAKTIKELDKAFEYAKYSSARSGLKFDYLYFNAYGSGFVKNNSIPNDLDFAVGINLGEYNYDEDSAENIAKNIVEKMNSFETAFYFALNMSANKHIYTSQTPFGLMNLLSKQRAVSEKNISDSLDTALSPENYVKYTKKTLDDSLENLKVDVPYIMKSHEILMENRKPIIVYSDLVRYNPVMPLYMREISIIPEFFVTVIKNGKSEIVEIVPESFLGNRLQLSRRFFASTVFTHSLSANFLKNLSYINNDEEYIYYRMLSYKRHLQDINNIMVMESRPVKLFKRLMQTADMIYPIITPEFYNEIADFVQKNLNNKDIQLLNEYTNLNTNLLNIMESPSLFFELLESGKIDIMYKTMEYTIVSMEKNGNIDTNTTNAMKIFQTNILNKMFEIKTINELANYRESILDSYGKVNKLATEAILSQVSKPEKIEYYIKVFNQIYIDAGYHKVSLYWLDNNTLGVVEDDFTKQIKDFKQFAKENDLIDINYKLIKPENVPDMKMRYDIFARYNATEQENQYYERYKNDLLTDRKNFTIKKNLVWCK